MWIKVLSLVHSDWITSHLHFQPLSMVFLMNVIWQLCEIKWGQFFLFHGKIIRLSVPWQWNESCVKLQLPKDSNNITYKLLVRKKVIKEKK